MDWGGGQKSIGGGGGRGFSFLVGAISAKVARFLAPEAKTLLHQFGSFLRCQSVVGTGDDVDVHRVWIFLGSLKRPSWFGSFFILLGFSSI